MRNSQRAKYILCICMLLVGVFSAVILYKSMRPSVGVPYEVLSETEAQEYMDYEEGYLLLDVQNKEAFEKDHLMGAANIPYDTLVESSTTLLPDKNQMIYVYGEDEEESRKAAMKLSQLGYTSVACLLRTTNEDGIIENGNSKFGNIEKSSEGDTDGSNT